MLSAAASRVPPPVVIVKLSTLPVVRESDGRTLLLVSGTLGDQTPLPLGVVEQPDNAPDDE